VWENSPFDVFCDLVKGCIPLSTMGFPNISGISAPFCAIVKCHNYNIFKEQMQAFFGNSLKNLKILSQNASNDPIYHHYICNLVYPFLFIIKNVIYLHFATNSAGRSSAFDGERRQNSKPAGFK
jgi:hypothetical protein